MSAALDLPERIVDFDIATDHIVVDDSGSSLQINDSQVIGISSHLVTEETLDYDRPTPKRRYVDIEFLDDADRARIVTVDEPNIAGAQLPDYIERVAVSARDNTLIELLEHDAVTRKGYTITDQGMMITASGQAVWFALPDLDAFDLTPDAGLLWQREESLPIATITPEDPNAAVLYQLLPRLVEANGAEDCEGRKPSPTRQMVDAIECKPLHAQTQKRATVGALFAVIVAVSGLLMNVFGVFPGVLGIASLVVPIAALVLLFFKKRSKTLLFVYRDGLSVIETRKPNELSLPWSELGASTLRMERIEIPTTYRLPNHIFTEVQLKLRCSDQTTGKRQEPFAWHLNEETALVTNYLAEKLNASQETEVAAVRA